MRCSSHDFHFIRTLQFEIILITVKSYNILKNNRAMINTQGAKNQV